MTHEMAKMIVYVHRTTAVTKACVHLMTTEMCGIATVTMIIRATSVKLKKKVGHI